MSKAHTALDEVSDKGAFVRVAAGHRNWIEEGGQFPPEANRYHLYISLACPWASRCLAVLYLKGLEDVIGLSVVHPTWKRTRPENPDDQHAGWHFADPNSSEKTSNVNGYGEIDNEGCIVDTVNGCKNIRELYEISKDTAGKYSVPVFWDKKTSVIVSNESADIVRMLGQRFNQFAKNPQLDLYPSELAAKIDAVNEWVYPNINDGVYKCGFAKSQSAYNTAVHNLFEALDRMEELLGKQRYLTGNQLTEADIRAFVTLIRFDEVYVVYFKTNKKRIEDYENIKNYVRELYQIPAITKSVNMDHIKRHYYTSHPILNAYAIIPIGGGAWWTEPHNRNRAFDDSDTP